MDATRPTVDTMTSIQLSRLKQTIVRRQVRVRRRVEATIHNQIVVKSQKVKKEIIDIPRRRHRHLAKMTGREF